ncbi:MAG: hypothetical protein PHV68_05145 [Candidatus Gastranaerophilales bacterium]|nr:hypothetical protein [Candidatus Gastranaerophilales bacterium]
MIINNINPCVGISSSVRFAGADKKTEQANQQNKTQQEAANVIQQSLLSLAEILPFLQPSKTTSVNDIINEDEPKVLDYIA